MLKRSNLNDDLESSKKGLNMVSICSFKANKRKYFRKNFHLNQLKLYIYIYLKVSQCGWHYFTFMIPPLIYQILHEWLLCTWQYDNGHRYKMSKSRQSLNSWGFSPVKANRWEHWGTGHLRANFSSVMSVIAVAIFTSIISAFSFKDHENSRSNELEIENILKIFFQLFRKN